MRNQFWNRSACDPVVWKVVPAPATGEPRSPLYKRAEQAISAFDGFPVQLGIAVLGPVVNSPGEAPEAGLSVSSSNGKGQNFVQGAAVKPSRPSKRPTLH